VLGRFALILVSSHLLACDYRFAKPRSITLCENSVISREVYTRGIRKAVKTPWFWWIRWPRARRC